MRVSCDERNLHTGMKLEKDPIIIFNPAFFYYWSILKSNFHKIKINKDKFAEFVVKNENYNLKKA